MDLAYLLDPWKVVDVALIAVLAAFIFRKSRVASTFLVVYFILDKLTMWYDMRKVRGLPLTVIFLLYYMTAMRGTYRWHAAYRNDPAAPSVS
jgi:hypothetical protein